MGCFFSQSRERRKQKSSKTGAANVIAHVYNLYRCVCSHRRCTEIRWQIFRRSWPPCAHAPLHAGRAVKRNQVVFCHPFAWLRRGAVQVAPTGLIEWSPAANPADPEPIAAQRRPACRQLESHSMGRSFASSTGCNDWGRGMRMAQRTLGVRSWTEPSRADSTGPAATAPGARTQLETAARMSSRSRQSQDRTASVLCRLAMS